jgi:Tol biopolymer transport system component
VWSADGSIIFTSFRGDELALWRVSASGRGRPDLVPGGGGAARSASVSRDGRRLAFSTAPENTDLVISDTQSGLEDARWGGSREEQSPTFSHDGASVFYLVSRPAGRGTELWRQPLARWALSGPAVQLPPQPGTASGLQVSPDGKWLAFSRVLNGKRSLWTMASDGSEPRRLTDASADSLHPAWSPDGRQLAFSSVAGGAWDIWAIPVKDGTRAGEARRITSGAGTKWFPAWSPDGKQIVFTLEHGQGSDIGIVDADGGSPPRRVTQGGNVDVARWLGADALAASGAWGGSRLAIRRVTLSGQADLSAPALADIGVLSATTSKVFDVSPDGRHVVFASARQTGDIMVADAVRR